MFYWFVTSKNLKIQNGFLLLASYYFYACWDWHFLFLLIFSTLLDYFTGLKMSNSQTVNQKKFWFWLSIGINLGFLGVFKYYNFFAQSFVDFLKSLGVNAHAETISIILPVGISFYTFHGLSYVIDIYKERIKPEKNFIDYALFVSYFPLLVAGPIERATHLLPQIKKKRTFNYEQATDGLRQILWGLFKKIVIADNCAQYANMMFDNPEQFSGSGLLLGAVFFAFQIYGDFSGYSDIALGTSRLLGINLLQNFSFPYFSRDIAEFWRRWHISLSSWFKDYLYIPLGGSKGNMLTKVRNTFIIFIVSGFWHGANWTFIIWGILNAIYFLPLLFAQKNRNNIGIVAQGTIFPSVKETVSMLSTFALTVLAWIFFRAESVTDAITYLSNIFSQSLFEMPHFPKMGRAKVTIFLVLFMLLIEWMGRENNYALEKMPLRIKKPLRYAFYYLILFFIFWYGEKEQQFIYFQF